MGAVRALGQKNPQECDLFERTVGQTITGLSQAIEQTNAAIADLEGQLSEMKEKVTKQVGEYEGWADALATYYASQAQQADGGPGVPVSAPGGAMPGGLKLDVTPPDGDPMTPTPRVDPPTEADVPGEPGPDEGDPVDEAPEPEADEGPRPNKSA